MSGQTVTAAMLMLLVFALAAASNGELVIQPKNKRPHLILLVADDFGWGNVGFHRTNGTKEVQTPNIDSLAGEGVIFDRFYSYKICSPSRCSLQTGRLPVHVNTVNTAPEVYNPEDPVSGYSGIPRNMTCIAEKLKNEGYRTAMTGKWDAGMATPRHAPLGRGYEKFLGYFHHANDYNTCGLPFSAVGEIDVCYNRFLDLWQDNGPAVSLAGTAYEEELFENHSLQLITAHDPATPLFLFHSFHLIHTPLQVPQDVLDLFAFIDYPNRQSYAAMVFYMDRTIGRLVQALKDKHMYEDSVILFFSDNGGPVYIPGSANNHPLLGGKYSDWEGGVRVNAFAAGGRIPPSRRGKRVSDLVHVSDVYASFIRLAHFGTANKRVSPAEMAALIHDFAAEEAGLPPVDSMDTLWRAITGGNDNGQKRTEIHLSSQALLSGRYKLVVGNQTMNMYQGPFYPNATGEQPVYPDSPISKLADRFTVDCGAAGCLFDVFADPTEHNNLASQLPQVAQKMLARLNELNKSEFKPNRGEPDSKACEVARTTHQGFYGPFLDLDEGVANDEQMTTVQDALIQALLRNRGAQ